jgi:hypothetical protein
MFSDPFFHWICFLFEANRQHRHPRPSACSGLASTATVSKPGSEATTEIENAMEVVS